MRLKTKFGIAIALAAVCGGLFSGCSSTAPHGISNFEVVEPGVYRGGQPTDEGWKYLASLRVSFVVKLNEESESPDPEVPGSAIIIRYPISLADQTIGKPRTGVIDAVAEAIQACKRDGVFVHCQHGEDRTGLAIGAWRVKYCGWTKQQAYKEMLEHNFHPILHGLKESFEEDVH